MGSELKHLRPSKQELENRLREQEGRRQLRASLLRLHPDDPDLKEILERYKKLFPEDG